LRITPQNPIIKNTILIIRLSDVMSKKKERITARTKRRTISPGIEILERKRLLFFVR
jgi:hypothetical protein